MRENCTHFESRSYPNGDTVRKCDLDLAPEAPWRCPADCVSFQRRRIDVNWSHGSLVTPTTPDEPPGLGDDDSIAALLDAAEEIINEAAPGVLADLDSDRGSAGKLKKRLQRGIRGKKGKKGKRGRR
ncbi:MAG: hypothetical protein ISR43_04535 [Acidimicrobiia bacterium]|nr:hypothetical protein [Acidimicrobiia bacterium]MBL6926478.1 hypothetical protein [Acidimicrobiia bacterium]